MFMPPKEKCGVSGKECGAKKRLLEKMPQGAGAFRRGCRGCGKANAQGRRAPEAFLLTEKTGFAGVERFRVGTTPPRVFDYGQIHWLPRMKSMQTTLPHAFAFDHGQAVRFAAVPISRFAGRKLRRI